MEPKTYRAPNTQAALELVQNELGPEAVILSVKQVPGGSVWETWKKPEVEVLAIPPIQNSPQNGENMVPDDHKKQNKGGSLIRSLYNPPKDEKSPLTSEDIQVLFDKIATQIAKKQSHPTSIPASPRADTPKNEVPPAVVRVREELLNQGVDSHLIKEIIRKVSQTANPKIFYEENRLREIIRKQLETTLRVLRIESVQKGLSPTARVLFVVGPSGVGKTSLCARLASHFTEKHQKKVAWICADTIRTGAIAQTRSYTEPLNIQPHIVYTPLDLREAIAYEEQADLILVDTPACNPFVPNEVIELSAFLTEIPQKMIFLTLPATLKLADMQQAVAAFSPLKLNGIVITKLDETKFFGHIINLIWKNKIPLAYFCDGTNYLDSLHPAEASYLVKLILP